MQEWGAGVQAIEITVPSTIYSAARALEKLAELLSKVTEKDEEDYELGLLCTCTCGRSSVQLVWYPDPTYRITRMRWSHALAEKKGLVQNYTLTRTKAGM